ncbi:MAG: Gfo/Idh/MocA family oxidoreductase [Planctomycetes bacterium]|nr:Gfo/Idh/MocA family oxidoreductase [Planctomycetota bacterium]
MNIGIIGAENSHTIVVAKLLNVDRAVRGATVTHVWGETRAFAEKAAEEGKIPTIVEDPREMLGKVDGIMVDHRDGKYHIPAVKPFVKAGVPVFVDKPMACSLAEARRFLKFRSECKVPVTTMSSIVLQPWAVELKKKLRGIGRVRALHLHGPGDYKSQYGGIWFYGIHQVELMTELVGIGATHAQMIVNGEDSAAVVTYPEGLTVTMNFLVKAPYGFSVAATGHEGSFESAATYDPSGAEAVVRTFTKMFRTGTEPFSDERMLAPLAVLEAMEKSLQKGTAVKVAKVE